MALLFHGFFQPSSHPHLSHPLPTSSPTTLPSLPLSRPSSQGKGILPLPFHVFPSGAHKWFFSISSLNCTSSAVAPVEAEQQSSVVNRTRLIAQNIPWTYTAQDVRRVFEKHGVVDDVELSMHNSTRNRGLAFITMASEEEAIEALNNLNLHELDGRIIRVEFAKSLKKKPSTTKEPLIKHNVFVGNLTWGVRSHDLREVFTAFNPNVLSVEVIFHTNPRRSAGYGFASFASKEEAESAVNALNGKKLMGRAIRLVLGKKEDGESNTEGAELAE